MHQTIRQNCPTVMGRELHKALEVKTAYKDWFKRMCEYGFAENSDFVTVAQKRATAQGNFTTYNDHQLTIPMAKEIQSGVIGNNKKGFIRFITPAQTLDNIITLLFILWLIQSFKRI